jgi:hypothetical protein
MTVVVPLVTECKVAATAPRKLNGSAARHRDCLMGMQ